MKRHLIAAICAVLAAVMVATGIDSQVSSADSNGPRNRKATDFCSVRVVRDYSALLNGLPSDHLLPASGKLGFGPKGLRLESMGGSLVVESGWVGFVFRDEAVGQRRHLNWDLTAELYRVDPRGESLGRRLGTKRIRLGSVMGDSIRDLSFFVSGSPSIYRVDLAIRDRRSGNLLGQYSQYWRLLRPTFDVRLLLPGTTVRRGEHVGARLTNFGTETVSSLNYNFHFGVEYFDGESWIEAPSDPPPSKTIKRGRGLTAGRSTPCFRFQVSDNETPGRYRVSAVVDRSIAKSRRLVATEFEVVAKTQK